jgi:ribonuclease VapC
MIVDTSALLAVLYQEDDAEQFVRALATAPTRRMSAANFLEAAINIDTYGDSEASRQLDNFIRQAGLEIVAITLEHAQIARQAYQDFGKGRHKAGLNFGDCFAYALARATGEPLLFKGNDFAQTDIALYPIQPSGDEAPARA